MPGSRREVSGGALAGEEGQESSKECASESDSADEAGSVSNVDRSGNAGRRGIRGRANADAGQSLGAGRVGEGGALDWDVFSRFVGCGNCGVDYSKQSGRDYF